MYERQHNSLFNNYHCLRFIDAFNFSEDFNGFADLPRAAEAHLEHDIKTPSDDVRFLRFNFPNDPFLDLQLGEGLELGIVNGKKNICEHGFA